MKFVVFVNDSPTGNLVDTDDSTGAIEQVLQDYKKHRIDVSKIMAYHVL